MSIATELESNGVHDRPIVEEGMAREIDRDFVATLAHVVCNILSPLGGSLELLNMASIDEISASQARRGHWMPGATTPASG